MSGARNANYDAYTETVTCVIRIEETTLNKMDKIDIIGFQQEEWTEKKVTYAGTVISIRLSLGFECKWLVI